MPQVILKQQIIQPATLFLQEILINIKTCHFHSSINHQESFFHRTLITSYFRPVNIAKFLRTAFLQNTSRSSRLQIFLKIGILKSFANFTGKHLCWSLFLKNLQAEGLQLHEKRLQLRYFPLKFAKNTFSYRTPPVTASASPVAASVFFNKVIKQLSMLFHNLAMTY